MVFFFLPTRAPLRRTQILVVDPTCQTAQMHLSPPPDQWRRHPVLFKSRHPTEGSPHRLNKDQPSESSNTFSYLFNESGLMIAKPLFFSWIFSIRIYTLLYHIWAVTFSCLHRTFQRFVYRITTMRLLRWSENLYCVYFCVSLSHFHPRLLFRPRSRSEPTVSAQSNDSTSAAVVTSVSSATEEQQSGFCFLFIATFFVSVPLTTLWLFPLPVLLITNSFAPNAV